MQSLSAVRELFSGRHAIFLFAGICAGRLVAAEPVVDSLVEGETRATLSIVRTDGDLRTYQLASNAELRDRSPADRSTTFAEVAGHATIRTGRGLFDGLYVLAVHEALQNSVSQIKDGAYDHDAPVPLEVFQTGEFWTYVWTRDLAYSAHLALAQFDPARTVNSLWFKTSAMKSPANGGFQIIQDTGSGGSYPVSSDRIVWLLGADAACKNLGAEEQTDFLRKIYPVVRDTIEQDRRLIFDAADGLYRGEQSFLDWREQTYPGWTRDNVVPSAVSKTISVNAAYYFALRTAADYARRCGDAAGCSRYQRWAENLKTSINRHFYDRETGLYSTCLLADGGPAVRVHRYDLLGEALAILLDVADSAQAAAN